MLTYGITLPSGSTYQVELRASLGDPVFSLYGPKYSSGGGLILSLLGTFDLDTQELRPGARYQVLERPSSPPAPLSEISAALRGIMSREELATMAAECGP